MKRAVGFCKLTKCEEFARGVFLLNHGPDFFCPRCKQTGDVVPESWSSEGEGRGYKEVRVEYLYDPMIDKYREIAIVRDESIWEPANTYTLRSPLIKTSKRALTVAEALLANLQLVGKLKPGDSVGTRETIIDMSQDIEGFKEELDKLSKRWESVPRMNRR